MLKNNIERILELSKYQIRKTIIIIILLFYEKANQKNNSTPLFPRRTLKS